MHALKMDHPMAAAAAGAAPAPATPGEPIYQCGTCKRQYKRADHLTRHVRSHTQSKPYRCRLCTKAFTRADLLKRHVVSHDSPTGRIKRPLSPNGQASPGRVTQACRVCASNHLRCTERKPCRRCTERGIECVWDRPAMGAITPPPTVAETAEEGGEASSPNNYLLETYGLPPDSPGAGVIGVIPIMDASSQPSQLQPFLGLPDFNLASGQWTPMWPLDFDFDTSSSIELDDMDLRFLDAYNTNVPFELGGGSPGNNAIINNGATGEGLRQQAPDDGSADPCRPAEICTETFRKHWKFRPNAQDHGAAEEHNLSLPLFSTTLGDHESPESRVSLDRRVTSARLSVAARDKILTTIVQSCRSENLSRAVASFPSVELLDTLLQYYLTSPLARADSFLHAAAFDPNEKRPEILAAMVACGAVLTSDPTLSKLGFAIQECVRVAVPKHWEEHNALTRDLELSQAFLITLEIGLWSGRSRKVEIAESFLQPAMTMLRRDGRLRQSGYHRITVRDDDEGETLRDKWRSWVEQESFKRLCFRLLQHDTNSSMALLINPLISYAEVQLPFPDSADLWSAATPEEWKALFLSQQQNHPSLDRGQLTLAEYVDDPARLDTHRNTVDNTVANFAFLSCAWSLSWEYIQLNSLQRSGSRRWNALLMASRHDEIIKLLNNFRISTADLSLDPQLYPQAQPCSREVSMRLELILLHLHMPFEDMQLFAGMEGPDQARVVYPTMVEWARGEAARKAVWHAGQIVRAARLLRRGAIWGPAAIAVYHASLAFWVFGLLSEEGLPGAGGGGVDRDLGGWAGQGRGPSQQPVYLDEAEGIALQRFTQLGSGNPCIHGGSDHGDRRQPGAPVDDDAYLSRPDRVMAAVMGIMRQNHEGMARPHLVDNLIQLMKGLQKASTKTGIVS